MIEANRIFLLALYNPMIVLFGWLEANLPKKLRRCKIEIFVDWMPMLQNRVTQVKSITTLLAPYLLIH